jgi:hypothetical protein
MSERPGIWLAMICWLGHVFACLLWIVAIHLVRAGMLFRAFVPAAKAPIGSL